MGGRGRTVKDRHRHHYGTGTRFPNFMNEAMKLACRTSSKGYLGSSPSTASWLLRTCADIVSCCGCKVMAARPVFYLGFSNCVNCNLTMMTLRAHIAHMPKHASRNDVDHRALLTDLLTDLLESLTMSCGSPSASKAVRRAAISYSTHPSDQMSGGRRGAQEQN